MAHLTPFGVGGAQPPQMGNIILQFTQSIAVLPFLAMGLTSPFVSADIFQPSLSGVVSVGDKEDKEMAVKQAEEALRAEKAAKIDAYFKARSMPLAGFGEKMVAAAESYGLDWRLLPAIAIRESSGGKQACGYNPFGWASCRIDFKSYGEAIETLARNLGGKNPRTAAYYSGTTKEKLHHYNGTVVPTYTQEVLDIMESIGK
ncbi:MAG: glucosaminidase domain-containing protein [Parcubacteria group bacterium]|nr:glucosaminidase domain-containing protein [Parcubacteria group bacterium]